MEKFCGQFASAFLLFEAGLKPFMKTGIYVPLDWMWHQTRLTALAQSLASHNMQWTKRFDATKQRGKVGPDGTNGNH